MARDCRNGGRSGGGGGGGGYGGGGGGGRYDDRDRGRYRCMGNLATWRRCLFLAALQCPVHHLLPANAHGHCKRDCFACAQAV